MTSDRRYQCILQGNLQGNLQGILQGICFGVDIAQPELPLSFKTLAWRLLWLGRACTTVPEQKLLM